MAAPARPTGGIPASGEEAPSCVCIADAIERVRACPPADLAQVRDEDLNRELQWCSEACMYGVAEPSQTGAIAALRRHIVDLVRQEVLAAWEEDPPDSGTMLDAMVRLESARKSCEVSAEQKLTAELAGLGGISLMAEVAHDMRSPLTSIVFLSEVLHKGHSGPLTDLQQRQMRIIYSAALGLTSLASDLIEINRSGRRRTSAPPSPFAVNGVLRSVEDLVRPLVEEKGVELIVEPLRHDRRMGFPVELSRVLLNLTSNALKYTQEGSVTLSARPVTASAFHTIRFSVADTGPGIAEDMTDRLYEALRYEPRRESGYAFSGTGLGLAICRRIVAWLGSELRVETGADGTCFSFELVMPPASSV